MAKTLSTIVGGGLTRKQEEFTASGTWTKPAGVKEVEFYFCGGGGGGGHRTSDTNGGAGGGGEIVTGRLPVAGDITVTIGAGGAGGIGSSFQSGVSGDVSSISDGELISLTADFGTGASSSAKGAGGGSGDIIGIDPISRYEGGTGGEGSATAPTPNSLIPDTNGVGSGNAPAGGSSMGKGGDGSSGGAGEDGVKGGGGGSSVNGSSSPANDAGSGGDGYCLLVWWE